MQTSSGENLTPQVEEGITCVAFKNKLETEKPSKIPTQIFTSFLRVLQ